jgi:hypothetical protein
MTFLSPRQLGAMDDSDEEMQLINDVALLVSQLEAAGCSCKEKMYAHLFRNLDDNPLAKRLKLWHFRQELSQNLVVDMLSKMQCQCIQRRRENQSAPGRFSLLMIRHASWYGLCGHSSRIKAVGYGIS